MMLNTPNKKVHSRALPYTPIINTLTPTNAPPLSQGPKPLANVPSALPTPRTKPFTLTSRRPQQQKGMFSSAGKFDKGPGSGMR